MAEKKTVFITGATGFLGAHLVKLLLEETNFNLILLIRGGSQAEAENRFHHLLKKIHKDDINTFIGRIAVLRGSLANEFLELDQTTRNSICQRIEEIYHCAALAEFQKSLEEVRRVNVLGTENLLKFAKRCQKIKKINYISTTFVYGDKVGLVSEDDLDVGQNFNNTYEQSKYEAELVVKEYVKNGLPVSIYRPSIITGEYETGETTNFRMFYKPFRSVSLGLFSEIPIGKDASLNLVAVDTAAKAIFILGNNEKNIATYNIVSPKNTLVTHLFDLSHECFKYKNPKYVLPENYNFSEITFSKKKILKTYLPYFAYRTIYGFKKTFETLEKYHFRYPEIDDNYIRRLFSFCKKFKYIKSNS